MPDVIPFFKKGILSFGAMENLIIPILDTAPDGTIYCAFSHDLKDICVTCSRDSGDTWCEPVRAISVIPPAYTCDANILATDTFVKVFTTWVPKSDGVLAHSEFLVSTSYDCGKTWSPHTVLPIKHNYMSGKVHAPVWMDEKIVVMGYSWDVPAEQNNAVATEGEMFGVAGILRSEDGGETWITAADIPIDIRPMGSDEPALVKLINGDLFAILRSGGQRPYEAVSHDGGLSFEKAVPGRFYGVNSPSALLRLADGGIIRVWNNSPANRFLLVASISRDECKTWSTPRTIELQPLDEQGVANCNGACYPSIAQGQDGTILVVWWYQAERSAMGYARFNAAWIEEANNAQKIVAFGDSITLGVRAEITERQTFRNILEEYLISAGHNAVVINAGVGSSNSEDALARMNSDVLMYHPDVVIINFGMNDAAMVDGPDDYREAPRISETEFKANLTRIVKESQHIGSKVVLCTPTPMTRTYPFSNVGAYASNDMNYKLEIYASIVRDVARECCAELVDLFAFFAESQERMDRVYDGCHPDAEGQSMMADQILPVVAKILG